MKDHKAVSTIVTAALLALPFTPAIADSMYANSKTVLVADDDLLYYRVDTGDSGILEPGLGATAVTVLGCSAIVTSGDSGAKTVQSIDLSDNQLVDPGFCNKCTEAFYDADEGVLSIPCVEVFGTVYTVDMKQRVDSNDWFVDFFAEAEKYDDEGYASDDDDVAYDDDDDDDGRDTYGRDYDDAADDDDFAYYDDDDEDDV